MAADRTEKKTERVTLHIGSSDFLLLSRAASLDDRSLGEFVFSRIVKPWLHGHSQQAGNDDNKNMSAFGLHGSTEK